MGISVVVGTFGDLAVWGDWAKRAVESVMCQSVPVDSVEHIHGRTLQEARNSGAERATGSHLCFLDADDTLDEHFVRAMTKKIKEVGDQNVLLQPSSWDSDSPGPVLHRPCNLANGNFLIIGTVVRRDVFLRLGGFSDLPILEDWELWRRFDLDGAVHHAVPDAIYRTTIRANSRNRDQLKAMQYAGQIRALRRNR